MAQGDRTLFSAFASTAIAVGPRAWVHRRGLARAARPPGVFWLCGVGSEGGRGKGQKEQEAQGLEWKSEIHATSGRGCCGNNSSVSSSCCLSSCSLVVALSLTVLWVCWTGAAGWNSLAHRRLLHQPAFFSSLDTQAHTSKPHPTRLLRPHTSAYTSVQPTGTPRRDPVAWAAFISRVLVPFSPIVIISCSMPSPSSSSCQCASVNSRLY